MLPSFAVLRSFEAAAKHQSYTDAADELRISQAAVSRQIKELEDIIGTQLFRKEGRGVALTAAGSALAANLHPGLETLRDVISKAQNAGETGQTLTIAVLPTFASRWLAKRLISFRRLHPSVRLTLKSRSEPFDLLSEGVDVAIHFGYPDWIGGRLADLCPEDLVAVASPAMIEESEVSTSQNIETLPLLHLMTRRSAWPEYFADNGLDPRRAVAGDAFDQFSSMIGAAIGGLGAAIVPSYLIEAELAQGTLVPFGKPNASGAKYYTVTPSTLNNPLAQAFCNWIRDEARTSTRLRQSTA